MANGLMPIFLTPSIPSLPNIGLSEDEAGQANWLATRLFERRPYLELHELYYDGMQKMQDLGISIPPQLVGLRTAAGWCQIGIDALVNRSVVEGFRFPGATDVDDDLMGIWQANNMDGEAPLAFLDAFIFGEVYNIVGPGSESTGGEPLITAESPLNMIVQYDARLRAARSGLQIYLDTNFTSDMYGHEVAALYLPGKTVFMARQSAQGNPRSVQWEIAAVDTHTLGGPPIVRMANRQRLSNRQGMSEMTAAWMNTTDAACRTLLGMEVSREFHNAPRRYALGVTEESFQKADGSSVSAWDAYLNKVWMIERDENGDVPTVGQFPASDPANYTKILDQYGKMMAGHMGVPSSFLGIRTDGNPPSADAIRAEYEELTGRSRNKHVALSDGLEETMRLALMVRDGSLPDGARRIETDWRDPAPVTPMATSQAITMQVNAGVIPATSDVTLKKLGYSAVERARLAADRKTDPGEAILDEIGNSDIAKAAIATGRLEKLINPEALIQDTPGGPPAANPQGG